MDTNEWLKANLPGPPLALSVALSSEDIAKVSEWLKLVQSAERERCAKPSPQPCALTWAIQRLNSTPYAMTKDECVEMLRGLRSEIQALSGPNVEVKAAGRRPVAP